MPWVLTRLSSAMGGNEGEVGVRRSYFVNVVLLGLGISNVISQLEQGWITPQAFLPTSFSQAPSRRGTEVPDTEMATIPTSQSHRISTSTSVAHRSGDAFRASTSEADAVSASRTW
jgi:hypothetical protein